MHLVLVWWDYFLVVLASSTYPWGIASCPGADIAPGNTSDGHSASPQGTTA